MMSPMVGVRERRGRRRHVMRGAVAAVLLAVLAGCGAGGAAVTPSAASNDLLAAILARGTVVVATDPAYPPQSFAREDATRTPGSKCEPNQLTAGELDGYDVQTAVAVAKQLDVEPCFVAPQWTEVTGGSWGDRWDISIGSMDISRDRMNVLYFAQPYYATPSLLFVHADSPFQTAADLAGMRIGACLDCTQYAYLDGSLDLPGQELEVAIPDPEIVGYDVEGPGLDDLAADNDKIDAFLASSSVGQAYIDEGKPIRAIDEPLFYGYSAPAFDRRASRDSVAFVNRITEIIQGLHADGTLKTLSGGVLRQRSREPGGLVRPRGHRPAGPLAVRMASPPASRIPWRRSLRVRLVAYFVAVSVATVAAVGVLAYARASTDLTNSVYDRLEAVSTLKADSLGRWLDEQRRNVVFVGSIPAVRDLSAQVMSGAAGAPDSDAARATQEALREELDLLVTGTSDATAINVIDLDGNIVVSTTPMFQNRNVAAEPYFIRGKSKTSVQNVYTSGLDARPTITVSTPLLDPDRRRIGVIAANLDIGRLDRIMDERSGLGNTGETYLVDAGHRFVGNGTRDGAGTTDTPESEGIDAAIAGSDGRGSYLNYREEPVLGVYRWLPDQEVGLIAELGRSEALAPAQDLAISTAVFGLLSAGLLAVLIWFIARQVTRPISQLTATAAAVAAGDLDARSGVRGSDEIGVLAASFDSMTVQLQESLTTLERRVEERTADLTAALEAKGEAEQRYRELVEQVPAVTYTDVTGVGSTYVSPQIERMFGVTQEQYTGDPDLWSSLLHPDDRERIEGMYAAFLDGTGPDLPDYRIVRPDGQIVWVRDRAVTTRDDAGRVMSEHGVMFDVTELKETEAAMAGQAAELARALDAQAETERRYRQLVELLPLMMYVDTPGIQQQSEYVSPQAEALFGYPVERWMEPGFYQTILHPDDRERTIADWAAIEARGDERWAQQYRLRTADGRYRWARDEAVRVRGADGEVVFIQGFIQDITDRVLAEEEVRRQKQYFEALVEISPVAVVTMDPKLRVSAWNPAAERLFGYTPDEAIGQDIDDLIILDPDLRADSLDLDRSSRADAAHHITRRQRKGGDYVDVEIIGVPLEVSGEFTGYYAIYHDITELQRARNEADEANQAKSTFLAAMSHEIRTPMNAIIGMSGLLLDTELTDDQHDYADTIRTSGDALLTIINDILDFSKIEAGKFDLDSAPFALASVVEGSVGVLAPAAAAKGLRLVAVVEPDLPARFIGDAGRIRQILLNLLSNAVKFTEAGEVVMTVGGRSLDDHPGELGCWELTVDVRDTGIGIPPDRLDRLFQSFSQVDASISRRYGGTGLGLAISRRLAELMHGSLTAESAGIAGGGATFHLVFEAEAAPMSVVPEDEGVPGGLAGRRALVVDDNRTHRRILIAHLSAWGIAHRDTGSPVEALGWVRRGERFDIAVVDVEMPEMDGISLAEAIAELPDPPPVVTLSGHGIPEAQSPAVVQSLTKPIRPSELHDALVTALMGRQPVAARATTTVRPEIDAGAGRAPPAADPPRRGQRREPEARGPAARADGLRRRRGRQRRRGGGALAGGAYDLVLMDVQMPELDGLEATRRIRERWPDRPLRIVGLTANAMAGDREACIAAGMDDYVSKPIRPAELAAAILATPGSATAWAAEAGS